MFVIVILSLLPALLAGILLMRYFRLRAREAVVRCETDLDQVRR